MTAFTAHQTAALAAIAAADQAVIEATGFAVDFGLRQQFVAGFTVEQQARSWAAKAEQYRGFAGLKAARRAAAMQAVADILAGVAAPSPEPVATETIALTQDGALFASVPFGEDIAAELVRVAQEADVDGAPEVSIHHVYWAADFDDETETFRSDAIYRADIHGERCAFEAHA